MSPLLQAFVKRLLQICPSQSPTFICASLITLSELVKHRPSIISLRYSGQVSYLLPASPPSSAPLPSASLVSGSLLSASLSSASLPSASLPSVVLLSRRCWKGILAVRVHACWYSDSWMKIVEMKGLLILMTKRNTPRKSRIPQIRLHSPLPPGFTRVTSPVSWICFTVTCFSQHRIHWCLCSITPLPLVPLFYHTTPIGESLQQTMTALQGTLSTVLPISVSSQSYWSLSTTTIHLSLSSPNIC